MSVDIFYNRVQIPLSSYGEGLGIKDFLQRILNIVSLNTRDSYLKKYQVLQFLPINS